MARNGGPLCIHTLHKIQLRWNLDLDLEPPQVWDNKWMCLIDPITSILYRRSRILESVQSISRFSRVRLCDPRDGSPPGSPFPGILQARTLEWVAISFSNAWKWEVKVKQLSHVWLFVTPWTVTCLALLSMEFSRQEHWSGIPFPPPGDLPDPGIGPESPALQVDSLLFGHFLILI